MMMIGMETRIHQRRPPEPPHLPRRQHVLLEVSSFSKSFFSALTLSAGLGWFLFGGGGSTRQEPSEVSTSTELNGQ